MYNNAQRCTTRHNNAKCTTFHSAPQCIHCYQVTQCSVITPTPYSAALPQYIPTLNKPATLTEPTMCCSELFQTNLLTRLGAFSRTGHGSTRHFLDGPQVRVLYNIIRQRLPRKYIVHFWHCLNYPFFINSLLGENSDIVQSK